MPRELKFPNLAIIQQKFLAKSPKAREKTNEPFSCNFHCVPLYTRRHIAQLRIGAVMTVVFSSSLGKARVNAREISQLPQLLTFDRPSYVSPLLPTVFVVLAYYV